MTATAVLFVTKASFRARRRPTLIRKSPADAVRDPRDLAIVEIWQHPRGLPHLMSRNHRQDAFSQVFVKTSTHRQAIVKLIPGHSPRRPGTERPSCVRRAAQRIGALPSSAAAIEDRPGIHDS